ncbi:MAG: hypothetical protein IPH88_07515 [Bacteroidales bacterium]|nr:hypothetical protein [Bacteroidales bacterium]
MKRLFFPLATLFSLLVLLSSFLIFGTGINADTEKEEKVPNDWMAYQRAYPSGVINSSAVIAGMMEAQALRANSPSMRAGWQFAGPTNIGGRITDVEVDPNDSTVVYLAGSTGGILKSTDNCQTWESIFDAQPILTIGDIAIDPSNSNVVYAGTGEANASSFSFLGNGMYKSTDAGATWVHKGLENSAFIARVIVDYSNPQRVFAAVAGNLFTPDPDRGIYRSDDGGDTWQRKLFVTDTTSGIDIVQHPSSPNILYASMWERRRGLNYRRSFGYSTGIFKSTDGGDTWSKLTNGLPTYQMGRIGLAIAPTNPDILYAFCDNISSVDIFKTVNGGSSWVQTNDAALQGMNSNFGWYFGQIRVDPVDENRAYVMGVEMWRTDDGGDNWIKLAGYDIGTIHVDHHAMYINPVTGVILEGNDGGLFRSIDYGVSWYKYYQLPLTQFYEVEIDYQNPNRLYGGTQDNNTIKTYSGNVNAWYPVLGGDGFYCLVSYEDPNTIYAEYQNGGLCKSIDGGNSFSYIMTSEMEGDRRNWSMPIAMDPLDPDVIFAGTHRIWKSDFGGFGWYPVSDDLTKGSDGSGWHTISTIAISKVNSEVILAGTDDGRVHISTDGGFEWVNITAGLPDRYVTRVATDPVDENIIYATFSGFRWDEPIPYVFRSTDKGVTWQDISGNLPQLPVNAIAIDPLDNNTIIVGTDAGVFFTKDAGLHWYALAEGIGSVPVVSFKIHEPTRMLLAGTYGRSSYKISLDDIQVGVSNPAVSEASLMIASNPFMKSLVSDLKIIYSLPAPSSIDLSILDLNGRTIKQLRSSMAVAGAHEVFWNGTSGNGGILPSGIYICRLKTRFGVQEARIILIAGS